MARVPGGDGPIARHTECVALVDPSSRRAYTLARAGEHRFELALSDERIESSRSLPLTCVFAITRQARPLSPTTPAPLSGPLDRRELQPTRPRRSPTSAFAPALLASSSCSTNLAAMLPPMATFSSPTLTLASGSSGRWADVLPLIYVFSSAIIDVFIFGLAP